MKRPIITAQAITLMVLALALAPSPAVAAAAVRNVLVLYSDDRLLPANIEIDQALRAAVSSSPERAVEFYAEFLDRSHFGGTVYEESVIQYLRDKYTDERRPQVVVAAGSYAVQLLLRVRDTLFPNRPLIHVGLSAAELAAFGPLPADVVGIPVVYDYAGTIAAGLQFHPNATRLVIVTGANELDRIEETRLRGETAHLDPRVTVEFLPGLPTSEVLKRLDALGTDAIVFTPGYFTDGSGRSFRPREAVQLIAAASAAPVYGPFSTFIGTGIVGGRMPSYVAMGEQAANIVNRLLDGVGPTALELPASLPSRLEIDWRQARRWGIEARIPRDAVLHFKEPTFWQAYGYVALIGLLVILLQAGLIAALLFERRLQQHTAQALAASERRMMLAARTARLTNWAWDLSADQHANGATANNAPLRTPVSKEPSTVNFRDVLNLTHPADREALARAVRRASQDGDELNVEYRMVERGHVRWFAARGRAEPGDATLMRGVVLDITQRKAAEIQAEQDRSALQHLTRVSLLGQLSASIAHQLNQPLAAILSNAEAAQKMLGRDNVDLQELKEICDDIVTEDHRAAQVIRRLGALYKHGERDLHPLDVNELIGETLELLRSDLVTRQVTTMTELAPDLPRIDGERVQLQQVLLNLVVNAADAMSEVAEQERSLRVSTELANGQVRVSVGDRGRGIPAPDLEHIFDPFWTNKPGGMGIGLAICRSITAAHGGALTAVNNADGGATFCLTLPARAV